MYSAARSSPRVRQEAPLSLADGAEFFPALERGQQFVVDAGMAFAEFGGARRIGRVDGAAVELEHFGDALLLVFQRGDLRRQRLEFALLLVAELLAWCARARCDAAGGRCGSGLPARGATAAARCSAISRARFDWISQSCTPPSYSRQRPSPSKAIVLVTTLSRKVRSWLTRNTVPS